MILTVLKNNFSVYNMGRIRRSYKLLDQRSFSDSRVQNTSNIFNVAVSGVVSSEKKDYHLQNGHYVLRFSVFIFVKFYNLFYFI